MREAEETERRERAACEREAKERLTREWAAIHEWHSQLEGWEGIQMSKADERRAMLKALAKSSDLKEEEASSESSSSSKARRAKKCQDSKRKRSNTSSRSRSKARATKKKKSRNESMDEEDRRAMAKRHRAEGDRHKPETHRRKGDAKQEDEGRLEAETRPRADAHRGGASEPSKRARESLDVVSSTPICSSTSSLTDLPHAHTSRKYSTVASPDDTGRARAGPNSQDNAALARARLAKGGAPPARAPERKPASAVRKSSRSQSQRRKPSSPRRKRRSRSTGSEKSSSRAKGAHSKEPKARFGWMAEGAPCSVCSKQVAAQGGAICARQRKSRQVVGCGKGVCWKCMNRARQEEFGVVKTTKTEFLSLGRDAWWMHQACMSPEDEDAYFGTGKQSGFAWE